MFVEIGDMNEAYVVVRHGFRRVERQESCGLKIGKAVLESYLVGGALEQSRAVMRGALR